MLTGRAYAEEESKARLRKSSLVSQYVVAAQFLIICSNKQ
jgi:hypothetical protein